LKIVTKVENLKPVNRILVTWGD